MEGCSRALSNKGWLVLNYHRISDPNGPYFRQLRKHFGTLLVFKSKTNNTIVYASKQPLEALDTKAAQLTNLEKRRPIDWNRLMKRVSQLQL